MGGFLNYATYATQDLALRIRCVVKETAPSLRVSLFVHCRAWRRGPDYLAGNCQMVAVSGRRPLRSAERHICHVPRQSSTFGDRSFAAAGPRTWNELPFSLRDTGLSLTFNEHLKTYLFSVAC